MKNFLFVPLLVVALLLGSAPVLAETPIEESNDKSPFFVSPVQPRTAIRDESLRFSSRVLDDDLLVECSLWVDDKLASNMTIKSDVAYTYYKFTENGTYNAYTKCKDSDDNVVIGRDVTLTVSSGSSHVSPGDLIKTGCEGDIYPNDPCTAVYYYGKDGRRHAFPNERTFNTWYNDFSDLVIISKKAMAEIPLGRNVTYRPGKRLIQFYGKTVYAVSYSGLLRPIASGAIAESIFGKDWPDLIEGVPDVFYTNYRIGITVESTNAYSPKFAEEQTTTIDDVIF